MATKLVIEPIFEANFLECSHGFRPGRSAHDAIRTIERTITFKGQRIVLDADIRGGGRLTAYRALAESQS